MNDSPALQLGPTPTERIGAAIGDTLRTTGRSFVARFRERRARRRGAWASEAIGQMNDHMLKDIGAPDWMMSRAAAQKDSLRRELARIWGPA